MAIRPSPRPLCLYSFGPFRLDTAQLLLFRGSDRVSLPPKDLCLLQLLVENQGRVVEKGELLEKVWPETFVEEGNLARHISTLRQALGDEKNGGTFIETIPRRGYRFKAPVEVVSDELPATLKGPVLEGQPFRAKAPWWRWPAIAGLLLVALGTSYFAWQRAGRPLSASDRVVLAVLPMVNYSNDPNQEYFADGLTEELITQLSQFSPEHLRIIARTSTMKYKGTRKAVNEIGRELGADYILEGSVRNDHDRMRISAQFIQVKDQTHLWAEDYNYDLTGITAMQDSIARAIAQEVRLTLAPATPSGTKQSDNPRAHEAYLRGRYYWNLRTGDGLWKSLKYFQQALEIEPTYPLAYVGLADAYILLGNYEYMETTEAFPRAQAAARRALELNDRLAEAHTSLAFTSFHYDYNWKAAEAEFRRALELNPSYATAHQWYAEYLATMGRHDEAREQILQARKLDPLSPAIQSNVGRLAYLARHYDEAIEEFHKVLAIDPDNFWAGEFLRLSLVEKGRLPEVIAEVEKGIRDVPDPGKPSVTLAYCYARAGRRAESRKVLKKIIGVTGNEGADAVFIAGVFAALGEKDEAFRWLERARTRKSFFLPFVSVFPWHDPLRSDPRFQDLLGQMELQPQAVRTASIDKSSDPIPAQAP